jgi:2-phosphoglycerate kinase
MGAATPSGLREDVMKLKSSLGTLLPPVKKPFLMVVCGLPGTGKSYVSGILAKRTGE